MSLFEECVDGLCKVGKPAIDFVVAKWWLAIILLIAVMFFLFGGGNFLT